MQIKQIPDNEYFAIPAFSNSAAKLLLDSPKHFKANSFNGSPASRIGTIFDIMMTSQDLLTELAIYKGHKNLGVKAQPFIDKNKDKMVVTEDEYSTAKKMYEAQDPHFVTAFRKTRNQVVFVGEIEGVPVKAKPDCISEEKKTIYDIKTTSKSMSKWERDLYDSYYHTQAAWYLKLARLAGLDMEKFVFFVVESSTPYCYRLFNATAEVIEDGEEDIERAFQIYKQCYLTDDWTEGYPDDVVQLERPYWRRKK